MNKADLEEFMENILAFFKKYSLEKHEPLDSSLLLSLKSEAENFSAKAINIINSLNNNTALNNSEFKKIISEYNEQKEKINDKYEIDLSKINAAADEKVVELKAKNEKITSELRNRQVEHELEIDFFKSCNDQNIQMFEDEYNNAISRFEYQKDSSEIAYNENVHFYNEELKEKLDRENEEYKNRIKDYDEGTVKIINSYNEKIDAINQDLSNYVAKFSAIQAAQKETKYNETVELNTHIRILVNENNQRVVAEKIDYSKDQNVNKIEHDMKNRELLLKSQSVSKDFVLKMTKLDNEFTNLKNTYNSKVFDLNRDAQYQILLVNKNAQKKIRETLSTNTTDAQRVIKSIKSDTRRNVNEIKRKLKRNLNLLNESFVSKANDNNHSRNLLDLDRSYSMKLLNEQESSDNKYFQELNNIDENDFNFRTKLHNNNYNLNANSLKLENSIKSLEIDTKFEKENAIHQIEIQKIMTSVKQINAEVNSIKAIQKKIHEIEENRHIKAIRYLTVTNLLEIEKCKTLSEYNHRNYELNVLSAKNNLDYSKSNINLQNERNKALILADIEIEKKSAEKVIQNNTNRIARIEADRKAEIDLQNLKLQYESEKLSNEVLFKKFQLESKNINQIITTFTLLIKEFEHTSTYLVDKIFDTIQLRPEHFLTVREFVTTLIHIIYEYYSKLVGGTNLLITQMVDNRIQFEKNFKYKSNHDEIEAIFNSQFNEQEKKRKVLAAEVEEISKNIDNTNQAIFALKNHIALSKNQGDSKGKAGKKNLPMLHKQLNSYYNELALINSKYESKKTELGVVEGNIAVIKNENQRRENEISSIQHSGSSAYFTLKQEVSSLLTAIPDNFKSKVNKTDDEITALNYEDMLREKRAELLILNDGMLKSLYDFSGKFITVSGDALKKNENTTALIYEKNHFKTVSHNNDIINEIINKTDRDERYCLIKISQLQDEKSNTKKKFDAEAERNEYNQNHTNIEGTKKKENTEARFYTEFYAVCDNKKSIEDDYNKTLTALNEESQNFKMKTIEELREIQSRLKADLNHYILSRKTYIKELPERTKAQKNDMEKETTDINRNIKRQKALDHEKYVKLRGTYFKNLTEISTSLAAQTKLIKQEKNTELRRESRNYLFKEKFSHE